MKTFKTWFTQNVYKKSLLRENYIMKVINKQVDNPRVLTNRSYQYALFYQYCKGMNFHKLKRNAYIPFQMIAHQISLGNKKNASLLLDKASTKVTIKQYFCYVKLSSDLGEKETYNKILKRFIKHFHEDYSFPRYLDKIFDYKRCSISYINPKLFYKKYSLHTFYYNGYGGKRPYPNDNYFTTHIIKVNDNVSEKEVGKVSMNTFLQNCIKDKNFTLLKLGIDSMIEYAKTDYLLYQIKELRKSHKSKVYDYVYGYLKIASRSLYTKQLVTSTNPIIKFYRLLDTNKDEFDKRVKDAFFKDWK